MDVKTFSLFFALLTVAANLFVLAAGGVWLASRFSPAVAGRAQDLRASIGPAALALAWIVAAVATAGSLYYSEVAGFIPCQLCWYQRIAMYPQALLLAIAAFRRDIGIRRYLIPLSAAGALISIYHYQLERFPSQTHVACSADASCTVVWVWQFHYISIPFMALSGFALIATLLLLARREQPAAEHADEVREEVVHA